MYRKTNILMRRLPALALGTTLLASVAAARPAGASSGQRIAPSPSTAQAIIYPGGGACPGGCGVRT